MFSTKVLFVMCHTFAASAGNMGDNQVRLLFLQIQVSRLTAVML